MRNQQPKDLKRRGFLLAAGIGGAGAVAVVAGGVGKTAAPQASPGAGAQKAGGYEETRHVSNYYRTARI